MCTESFPPKAISMLNLIEFGPKLTYEEVKLGTRWIFADGQNNNSEHSGTSGNHLISSGGSNECLFGTYGP